jgi:hypothetical protein
MRTSVSVSVVCGLVMGLAGAGRADDAGELRAIIDKAIKATGGEEKLAKYKAITVKEKGTYYGMGAGQPYTATEAMQIPNQFKFDIQGAFVMVLNRDKGWISMGGNVEEMTKEQVKDTQDTMYVHEVGTLVPLKDKAFHLAPLGESKVGDRAVVGVKVTHKGRPDVNLYFDKDTGLISKVETRVRDMMTGKEVDQETTYSNYKEVSGVQLPTKIEVKREGKQYVEAEIEEVKLLEKLDDDVFAKP